MPARLTVAQIESLIVRDEAQLAAYYVAEQDGPDPVLARDLARLVEQRLAILRQTREARAADAAAD